MKLKPVLSSKNKYRIDRHRYYELKHFALQYNTWKKIYNSISELKGKYIIKHGGNTIELDPTSKIAIERDYYGRKIELIENTAKETDKELYNFILLGITNGYAYEYLKSSLDIPCSRDTYYDRYRKFFWILDGKRV